MDEAAIRACARLFCLRLPRARPGGLSGERLGAGVGSSLELQDFRAYAPGDDLRHVDWGAYARTGDLYVRLHREEVAPRLEVVVDGSASMASDPAKEERLREILSLLWAVAQADRFRMILWIAAGDGAARHAEGIETRIRALRGSGAAGLEVISARPPAFARNSIRIAISDFLFPAEPAPLTRTLARGAASLACVALLSAEEREPTLSGGKRLVDVETGGTLDLVVTEASREAYRRRRALLAEGYRAELARCGGRWAEADASAPLARIARGALREAGILSVRGLQDGSGA